MNAFHSIALLIISTLLINTGTVYRVAAVLKAIPLTRGPCPGLTPTRAIAIHAGQELVKVEESTGPNPVWLDVAKRSGRPLMHAICASPSHPLLHIMLQAVQGGKMAGVAYHLVVHLPRKSEVSFLSFIISVILQIFIYVCTYVCMHACIYVYTHTV